MNCPKCHKPMKNIPDELSGEPSNLWLCQTKDCQVSAIVEGQWFEGKLLTENGATIQLPAELKAGSTYILEVRDGK